jgi:hemerythrin superfamily protein
MTGHEGNVIAELLADHREVEGLFEEYGKAAGDDHARRREIADQFTIELVRHSVAEEQYLYPAVREHVPDGDAMADKEVADHQKVEELLKLLEIAKPSDRDFDDIVRKVIDEVSAHVKDEEDRLFPELVEVCPQDYLFELGDKVRAAKAVAPTRPHPDAPDNKLATAAAGLVDRVRDLLTGRGRS